MHTIWHGGHTWRGKRGWRMERHDPRVELIWGGRAKRGEEEEDGCQMSHQPQQPKPPKPQDRLSRGKGREGEVCNNVVVFFGERSNSRSPPLRFFLFQFRKEYILVVWEVWLCGAGPFSSPDVDWCAPVRSLIRGGLFQSGWEGLGSPSAAEGPFPQFYRVERGGGWRRRKEKGHSPHFPPRFPATKVFSSFSSYLLYTLPINVRSRATCNTSSTCLSNFSCNQLGKKQSCVLLYFRIVFSCGKDVFDAPLRPIFSSN